MRNLGATYGEGAGGIASKPVSAQLTSSIRDMAAIRVVKI